MKFCIRPRQTHDIPPVDAGKGDPALRHRAAMEAWVAAGKDAAFDLCVQLATPDCIPAPGPGDPPKDVMAAEYCDLQWDEVASPYVKVGTLSFPATPQADLSKEFPWSPLQFNAWNTLASMAPLGQTFRARRHAHKAHAEVRLKHLYGTEPGAMVGGATSPERRHADYSRSRTQTQRPAPLRATAAAATSRCAAPCLEPRSRTGNAPTRDVATRRIGVRHGSRRAGLPPMDGARAA